MGIPRTSRPYSLALMALLLGGATVLGCDDRLVAPGPTGISFSVSPSFSQSSQAATTLDQLRIVIELLGGANADTAKDTTVAIDLATGSVDLELEVRMNRDPQTYRITIGAIRSSDGFVAFSGSSQITIGRSQASQPQAVQVPVSYAGAAVSRVEITPRDTVVQPGATFTLGARAFDASDQEIPALFSFTVNPLQTLPLVAVDATTGAVTVGTTPGQELVKAETPDGTADQALISIGAVSPRHMWIVDPANAQASAQFGTPTFPFSTITQGINRAAAGDTVFVAVNTYNEILTGTRSIVLLGDSTIAGIPVVTNAGPIGSITATGPITIKQLAFQGSAGPLGLQGSRVDLKSLAFLSNQNQAVSIAQTPIVTFDSVIVDGATPNTGATGAVQILNATNVSIRNVIVTNTGGAGLQTQNVNTLEIVQSEFSNTAKLNSTAFGVEIGSADSIRVDTTDFIGNTGGALGVSSSRVFNASHIDVLDNHFGAVEPSGLTARSAIVSRDNGTTRITNSLFDNNTAANIFVWYTTVDGLAVIENNSITGRYWGVRAFSNDTLTGRLEVRSNTFTGDVAGGLVTRQVGAGPLRTIVTENNTFIDPFGDGVFTAPGDSVLVRNNIISNIDGFNGIIVQAGRANVIDLNNITCVAGGTMTAVSTSFSRAVVSNNQVNDCQIGIFGSNQAPFIIDNNTTTCASTNGGVGIQVFDSHANISNNLVSGCFWGGYSDNPNTGSPFTLNVTGNTFERGNAATIPMMGFQVWNSASTVVMRGNTVQGGDWDPFGGLSVFGQNGAVSSATIVSNTVQGGTGRALGVTNVNTLVLDSNLVTGLSQSPSGLQIAAQITDINTSALMRHNQFLSNNAYGFFIANRASNVVVDSNLIDGNLGPGLWIGTQNSVADMVTARYNTIRGQTTWGIFVSQMNSIVQMNNIVANVTGLENQGTAVVNATGNWWNNVLGPSGCQTCDLQSSGDALFGLANYVPFATSPIIGPPPGPPVSAPLVTNQSAPMPAASIGQRVVEAAVAGGARRVLPRGGGMRSEE